MSTRDIPQVLRVLLCALCNDENVRVRLARALAERLARVEPGGRSAGERLTETNQESGIRQRRYGGTERPF